MESRAHDLILINGHDILPKQMREFLHAKGFASTLLTEIEQIYDASKQLRDPIIIIGAGHNAFSIQKLVGEFKSLKAMTVIKEIPVILIGAGVTRIEPLLSDLFDLSATIEFPCTNAAILEQLEYIASIYRTKAPQFEISSQNQSVAPVSLNSSIFSVPNLESDLSQAQVVPQLFFDEISGALGELTLNGEQYCLGKVNDEYLKSLGYFNLDQKTLSIVEALMKGCDRWSRLHLCRVAFITGQISQYIKFNGDADRYCISASLLYPLAFAQQNPTLLRLDYMHPGRREERQRISQHISAGAKLVGKFLGSEDIEQILENLSSLLSEKERARSDDLSLVAEMILVADLVDRVCFRSGAWDPRAAQTLLHRIKKGYFFRVHQQILLCVIKFLTEAVLARSWKFLLPKAVRQNMALVEQARRHKEMLPEKSDVKVALSSLRPGMRLSQPVLAFDGRMILDSDLKLDSDLIWRLWELAAKRPLNSPVIVGRPG